MITIILINIKRRDIFNLLKLFKHLINNKDLKMNDIRLYVYFFETLFRNKICKLTNDEISKELKNINLRTIIRSIKNLSENENKYIILKYKNKNNRQIYLNDNIFLKYPDILNYRRYLVEYRKSKMIIKMINDKNLKKPDLRLFSLIYWFNKKEKNFDMSNEEIANRLKISISTVQRSIKNLSKNKYIHIKIKDNKERIIFI